MSRSSRRPDSAGIVTLLSRVIRELAGVSIRMSTILGCSMLQAGVYVAESAVRDPTTSSWFAGL